MQHAVDPAANRMPTSVIPLLGRVPQVLTNALRVIRGRALFWVDGIARTADLGVALDGVQAAQPTQLLAVRLWRERERKC